MKDHRTDWLYYVYEDENSLDASFYEDPKYLGSLKNKWEFTAYLKECPINELLEAFITIFKDKYPRRIIDMLGSIRPKSKTGELDHNRIDRKANDIDFFDLTHGPDFWECYKALKIEFTEPQPDAIQWVKNGLADNPYTIEQQADKHLFKMEDQIIKQITLSPTEFFMELNLDLGENYFN